LTTREGWKAVWRSGTAGVIETPKGNFKIYPNPAGSVITYQLSGISEKGDLRIEIWDLYGRMVEAIPVPVGQDVINSDVSGYTPGAYIAIVRSGKGIMVMKKFVVD
jgi:hypothetical protein